MKVWVSVGVSVAFGVGGFAGGPSALAAEATAAEAMVRFATFNASLNRNALGSLLEDLTAGAPNSAVVDYSKRYASSSDIAGLSEQQRRVLQIHNVAEIIQRIDPAVLLVNEFDFDDNGVAGSSSVAKPYTYSSKAAQLLQDNFLDVAHGGGTTGRSETAPVQYPYRYTPPTNTGIGSGLDFDNNGSIGGTGDAFGFGVFPGQYGFTIYSKYPIKSVRSFQNFLWKDMPGNLLTNDPTADAAGNLANFFSPEEINALRLPSKNHVDLTIDINGTEVHFLAAHPTPPIATGPEARNAKHNHDEIRFWSDYITGGATAAYIYDDQGGRGGLVPDAIFVIAGDYNADPNDGDSYEFSIRPLLANPAVNTLTTPASEGGIGAATDPDNNGAANAKHVSDPKHDTADFSDAGPGNLRVDYVLPSANVSIKDSGVFWPAADAAERPLVGEFNQPDLFSGLPSSDHKAVYVDVVIP